MGSAGLFLFVRCEFVGMFLIDSLSCVSQAGPDLILLPQHLECRDCKPVPLDPNRGDPFSLTREM